MSKDKGSEKKAEAKSAAMQIAGPWEQMEHLMDEFVPARWMQRWGVPDWGERFVGIQAQVPHVDVIDRDDEVLVKAEIPGVRKEDVELSVTDTTLTVAGKTQHEEKESRENFYRREIRRGEFSRTVALPAAVDTEKASAKFEDGMLMVSLPKVTKTARKRLEIA